jgi:hypothetical protein
MDIEYLYGGVFWICKCYKIAGSEYDYWKWNRVPEKGSNQRAKNTNYLTASLSTVALINSSINHTTTYGNFGDTAIQLFGISGNPIDRPLGVRIIVGKWTGSGWQACHDSNWHYTQTNRSTYNWHNPADCGAGYYRAQSAGRYWSYTLADWVTTGWVVTASLCINPPCGVAPPA